MSSNPASPADHTPGLATLLARRPAEDLAIFSSLPESQHLAETLVALANGHGGSVVLIVEQPDDWSRAADLVQEASLLAQPPLILPRPVRAELTTRKAVVVTVPPGLPHIYNLRGTFWVRGGAQNRPLRTEELRSSLVYEVRVQAQDPQDRLRLGMPATVTIPLSAAPSSGSAAGTGTGHAS